MENDLHWNSLVNEITVNTQLRKSHREALQRIVNYLDQIDPLDYSKAELAIYAMAKAELEKYD